jgi:hypothetical protein
VAGGREFDRSRVTELVLYLGQRSSQDDGYGMTKLNKLLYRADSEAFRLLGASITGAMYQKEEFGPVLTGLQNVVDDMASKGLVQWAHVDAGAYQRHVPGPRLGPDLRNFTPQELEIIDAALAELAPHGGRSVSEWSHREWAGWRITDLGQPIPYETAIIASEPGPPKTVARLRERVLSGNWD